VFLVVAVVAVVVVISSWRQALLLVAFVTSFLFVSEIAATALAVVIVR